MKQAILRLAFLFTAILSAAPGNGQSMPKLVGQVTFETGLTDVQANTRGNLFLAISGDNYTLIDQASKIQLGTLVFDAGGWGAQGVGKTALMADGSVLISTGFVLVKANPVTGTVDTFFNQIKYPEMIENFTLWPGDETKVLIHTKTYPLKKDSSISYLSDNKESSEYLGAVDCKLYLVDATTKTTGQVTATNHLITAFSSQARNGQIVAGTHAGDVVSIAGDLQQNTLFHAFDTVIHQLLIGGDAIVAVPAQAPKYVGGYGDGRVCIFKNGKRENEITLDTQQPAEENSMGAPSSSIFRVFYSEKANSILVNYAFSRLVAINLATADTLHYPITCNMAKFYCWGADSTQLLAATDEIQDVFATSRRQDLYDINSKKFQPAFRQLQLQDKYTRFYKLFDAQGNYHIAAYKSDYSSDTLVVFSSNKTQPTTIACQWCKFVVDDKNNTVAVIKYNRAKMYKLLFNKMQQSTYTLNFNEASSITELVFSTETIAEEKLPETIIDIQTLGEGFYVVGGENNVLVVNHQGQMVWEAEKLNRLSSGGLFAVSPTKKYLAIVDAGDKKHSIAVWDWQAGKKVVAKTWDKGTDIQHFTFDKTRDVMWCNTNRWIKGAGSELINEIYSIDITAPTPYTQLMFTDPRFFSFEVDMQADRVAFEAYSELYVAKLSTRELLWQQTPRGSFFQVGHLSNGFTFSTEEELHTVLNDKTQLYFTTYAGRKPIEVANNYLYKGEKSAINNLAFVYGGKGYLPAEYDIYFNRPDSVILLSGATNHEFNTVLNGAFAKRKRKLQAVSLADLLGKSPSISISNKNQLPLVVTGNNVGLTIAATSAHANITRLHIIANGVPVFGSEGLVLSASKAIHIQQKVLLQKGNNTLQVYVTDEKGIKSTTETINIVADYVTAEPKTYFVGIGIDVFKDSGHNLSYSVKDIRDLAAALKAKLGNTVVIDTLFNQNVSVENVQALRKRLLQTGVNDKVIISYSGHGMLDKQLNYYLSTYTINFRNPQQGGLPYAYFENLLDSLPARKKLLLIDACHSGEVDKEELANMRVVFADTSKHISDGGKSGIELLIDDEQTVGLKNSFELMQELFTDVGRGTGATIISAAAGTQVAYEKGELQNGVFTYCVLQLLAEKSTCTVQELKDYVSAEVERRTNGLQKPTSRTETAGFEWQVW